MKEEILSEYWNDPWEVVDMLFVKFQLGFLVHASNKNFLKLAQTFKHRS